MPDLMMRFHYERLHIPSGERSSGECDASSPEAMLEYLNELNRSAPGAWQYWIEPSNYYGRPI